MISTASSTARRRQRAEYELYKAEFEQLESTERIPNAWFLLRILCAFRLAPGLFRLYPRMRVARQSEKQHNAHTFVNWLSTFYSPLQGAGFYGLSTFYSPSMRFALLYTYDPLVLGSGGRVHYVTLADIGWCHRMIKCLEAEYFLFAVHKVRGARYVRPAGAWVRWTCPLCYPR